MSYKAKGLEVDAVIMRHSDDVALVPMSNLQIATLISELSQRMRVLKKSGDYPEYQRDKDLLENLHTASFILTRNPKA